MKTKFLIMLGGVMVFALAGCGRGNSNNPPAQTNAAASSSSPVVQPEIYAQQKTEVASLDQAVQQYRTAEGHNPGNLQQLTPNYISKIPQAPPGYKINYNPNSGLVSMVKQ